MVPLLSLNTLCLPFASRIVVELCGQVVGFGVEVVKFCGDVVGFGVGVVEFCGAVVDFCKVGDLRYEIDAFGDDVVNGGVLIILTACSLFIASERGWLYWREHCNDVALNHVCV